jgi:hypothetical protein
MVIIIIAAIVIPVLTATITLLPLFPAYRRTYNAIATGAVTPNYQISTPDILFLTPSNTVTNSSQFVIFFRTTGDIKLLGGGHLHRSAVTLFSPWSLFWFIKITKLIKSVSDPKTPLKKHDYKTTEK